LRGEYTRQHRPLKAGAFKGAAVSSPPFSGDLEIASA